MKTKTAVIIAVVVIGLISLVATTVIVVVDVYNGFTGENSNVTYNYEVVDSISSYDYYTEYYHDEIKASDGKVFAVVKVIEKNNNCLSSFYSSTGDFKFVCSNGSTYSRDYSASYNYNSSFGSVSGKNLSKGQSCQYTALVEIPAGTSITDVKFDDSSYTSYRDIGLKIDSTVGNYEKGTPSVLYNFKFDKMTDTIGTHTAGEGKTYMVYVLNEKNNNVSKGLSITYLSFRIKCSDGNTYSADSTVSSTYPDTSAAFSTTLGVGNSVTYHLVFEISTSLTENASIVWNGSYSGAYDSTLPVAVS